MGSTKGDTDRGSREVSYFPASEEQTRFWILEHLAQGSGAYHISRAFRLEGALDLETLRKALRAVLGRHEALRTRFKEHEDGRLLQGPGPVDEVPLDIAEASEDGPDSLSDTLAKEAEAPFDLRNELPCRFKVLRLGPEDHVLQTTFHHIAFDGWSFGVFLSDLQAFYAVEIGERDETPADLPIQYVDYTHWRKQQGDDEDLDASLAYWTEALEDCEPLTLPTDRTRPPVSTYEGDRVGTRLEGSTVRELVRLARDNGKTPYMAFLAVFKTLLHRYTERSDVVVGTTVAGRNAPGLEDLVGLFLNNLPLRTPIGGDLTFREVLERVGETCLEAFEHQDVPFDRIVSEVAPDREASINPLFQIYFGMHRTEDQTLELPGLEIRRIAVPRRSAHFDLSLEVGLGEDSADVECIYDTSLFDRSRIDRFVDHLETLASAAVEDPDTPIADLTMLSSDERREVLAMGEGPVRDYDLDRGLHEPFEAQAEATPDRVALASGETTVSYGELEARANRLARHLRALGIGSGDLVGVCLPRGVDLTVTLLGILKAGGGYVPLDPGLPGDRVRWMMRDAGVSVVVTRSEHADLLAEEIQQVRWDEDRDAILERSSERPDVSVDPDDPVYAIYTSGTTGKPKGVLMHHRGPLNRIHSMQDAFELGPDDRVLQKTPVTFDVSVWQFFWPLAVGARIVLVEPGEHRDPERLAARIDEHDVTVVQFVPSQLRAMLMVEGVEERIGSLRHVISSGEPLPYEVKERFVKRFPDVGLHNLYGPTEASITVSHRACRSEPEGEDVSIGRPTANVELRILDERMNPLPVGVPGDLYIGGVQLADGYLGRPEKTAEAFVEDPLSKETGARLYRTGDVAAWREDGSIEFLGREDDQVQIGGVRVEPQEIEAEAMEHGEVHQALVRASDGNGGATQLVCYVVSEDPESTRPSEIRSHLASRLPDYMVPSHVVTLEEFPLTPNGKIDREALPRPQGRPDIDQAYEPPESPLEQALADIFREVLDVEDVGVHDDFFDLGGDSLSAMRALARIRRSSQADLSLTSFFPRPTVAGVSEMVADQGADLDEGLARPAPTAGMRHERGISLGEEADESPQPDSDRELRPSRGGGSR